MLTLSIYTSYRDHFTIVLLLFGILEIKKFFFCAVPSPLVVLRVYFCWKRETFFWNVQHTGKSFFAIPKRDNTNFLLVNFTNFHGKNGTGNVMNTIFFFFCWSWDHFRQKLVNSDDWKDSHKIIIAQLHFHFLHSTS